VDTAVTLQLRASYSLNLITNKFTNISGRRISNTSAITNNSKSFYISNIEPEPGKLGAEEFVKEAVSTAQKITNRDLL
jgi:hypothetical protein